MAVKVFKNIKFDLDSKEFLIEKGNVGSYDYREIVSAEIVYEKGKTQNMENPFHQCFRERDLQLCTWSSGFVLVGIKINFKDEKSVFAYISEKGNQWQSLGFYDDVRNAQEIEKFLKIICNKNKKA